MISLGPLNWLIFLVKQARIQLPFGLLSKPIQDGILIQNWSKILTLYVGVLPPDYRNEHWEFPQGQVYFNIIIVQHLCLKYIKHSLTHSSLVGWRSYISAYEKVLPSSLELSLLSTLLLLHQGN